MFRPCIRQVMEAESKLSDVNLVIRLAGCWQVPQPPRLHTLTVLGKCAGASSPGFCREERRTAWRECLGVALHPPGPSMTVGGSTPLCVQPPDWPRVRRGSKSRSPVQLESTCAVTVGTWDGLRGASLGPGGVLAQEAGVVCTDGCECAGAAGLKCVHTVDYTQL